MDQQAPRDDFLPQRPFPVEAPAPPPSTAPVRQQRGIFSRYVLPVALFLVIVAVTAWVTQNLPSWRGGSGERANPDKVDTPPVFAFSRVVSSWDIKDNNYVKPFEIGDEGHYDFPFRNTAGVEALVGLEQASCDCASVQVCTLPTAEWEAADKALASDPAQLLKVASQPTWHKLEAGKEAKGVAIPADGRGMVRVNWHNRDGGGQRRDLKLRLWCERRSDAPARSIVELKVATRSVYPYLLETERATVGAFGKDQVGRAEFDAYSLTRPTLDLKVKLPENGFYEAQVTPLSDVGLADLRERLKTEPRILCGYHITISIHEQKNGKEMDLGPFVTKLPILLDDLESPGAPLLVSGRVKGDVEVGGADDYGKINLQTFKVTDGTRQVVPVWVDSKEELKVVEKHPPTLEVDLRKDTKQLRPNQTKWLLEVSIAPDDVPSGVLPEASAIVLRLGSNPRLVRIPVSGIAIR